MPSLLVIIYASKIGRAIHPAPFVRYGNCKSSVFTCPFARSVWVFVWLGSRHFLLSQFSLAKFFLALLLSPWVQEVLYDDYCCHLFGHLVHRNKITFEGQIMRSPLEVVFTACSTMLYWARLLKVEDRASFRARVQRVIQMAPSLADRPAYRERLMIQDAVGAQRG